MGPPTHFGGYTIGPAFYWILWAIRITVGPFFDNLPHAGGIGQAILQSGADTLLLAAVWHRTKSVWISLTAVVLLATSAYDLCLAPLVWNPVMGSILAKAATALVLLDWHHGSAPRTAATTAVAWSAVHAYTGAVYVALSVFAALLIEPLVRKDRRMLQGRAAIIVLTVALLQVPYLVHRLSNRSELAMGAVTGSLLSVVSGTAPPQFEKSVTGYLAAFSFIQGAPNSVPRAGWLLLVCSAMVAVRYRRDPLMLALTLLPQFLALVGYALFLGGLDHYYYLSLMPAAVLTVLLAATALPSTRLNRVIGVVLLGAALAGVPERLRYSATLHKMPEYGALVEGSRRMARLDQPMREIETDFTLPPTADRTFVYRILGGRIDRTSPWVARINADGEVVYRKLDGS